MHITKLDLKVESRTPLYNVQPKSQPASQATCLHPQLYCPVERKGDLKPHVAMVKLLSCCMECILIVPPINIHIWTVLAGVYLDCASLHVAEIQGPEVSEHQVLGFQFNPEHLSSLHSTWKELGGLQWDVKYLLLITTLKHKAVSGHQLYKLDAWVNTWRK